MSSNSTNNSVIRKEQTNTSGNVTSAIDEDNTTLIQTSTSDTNLNENKKIIDESKEGSSLNLITTSTSTITKPSNDELNTNSISILTTITLRASSTLPLCFNHKLIISGQYSTNFSLIQN